MLRQENIVHIQSLIRGKLTRKSYRINPLSYDKCEFEHTFVVGNDPIMELDVEKYSEITDKIAIVATSGLRVVSLACQLGNKEQLPKIILIDNSYCVVLFWKKLRELMRNDNKAANAELLKIHLPDFLNKHKNLYEDTSMYDFSNGHVNGIKYPAQYIPEFFDELIATHGYDYVRNVILHASVFMQDWADNNTFVKIKNILNLLGINRIYAYPSNIVHCNRTRDLEDQILENIASLFPTLAIHTDYCSTHLLPERIFYIEDQTPSKVSSTLFPFLACVKSEDVYLKMLQTYICKMTDLQREIEQNKLIMDGLESMTYKK